jgi:hypothetical protein
MYLTIALCFQFKLIVSFSSFDCVMSHKNRKLTEVYSDRSTFKHQSNKPQQQSACCNMTTTTTTTTAAAAIVLQPATSNEKLLPLPNYWQQQQELFEEALETVNEYRWPSDTIQPVSSLFEVHGKCQQAQQQQPCRLCQLKTTCWQNILATRATHERYVKAKHISTTADSLFSRDLSLDQFSLALDVMESLFSPPLSEDVDGNDDSSNKQAEQQITENRTSSAEAMSKMEEAKQAVVAAKAKINEAKQVALGAQTRSTKHADLTQIDMESDQNSGQETQAPLSPREAQIIDLRAEIFQAEANALELKAERLFTKADLATKGRAPR